MANNITLTIIKPYAVHEGLAGEIFDRITKTGYKIIALKQVHLTKKQAEIFYSVHKGKDFYDALTDYMSSGPIIASILEKNNAVEDYRIFIGSTDPVKAKNGTLRKIYGFSLSKNAVHGSDSDKNAEIEANFFFSGLERY